MGERVSAPALLEQQSDTAAIDNLQRRLRMLGLVNITILLSVVWAMVSKPTF